MGDSVHFRNQDRKSSSKKNEAGDDSFSNREDVCSTFPRMQRKRSRRRRNKEGKGERIVLKSLFSRKILLLVSFLCVVALVLYTLLTEISSIQNNNTKWWGDENVHPTLGHHHQSKTYYAVIIDAGSTGSRVSAFEFHRSFSDKSLKLESQLFEEIKPGLSSFADNPQEGSYRLKSLVDKAREFVPKEKWAATPILLKATAGLRLLPKKKADGLLDAVSKVIRSSGFSTNENSVGIMGGIDEGIFSWFTVNFLLGRIGGPVPKTVAALDLGGGSIQITVESSMDTHSLYPKEDIQNVSFFHQSVPLYTKSYLGLGLQSVRKSILSVNSTNPKVLASACVNPLVSRDWTDHYGETHTIKGIANGKFENVIYNGVVRKKPVADWDECYNQIVKLIEEKGVTTSKDLDREVVIFSYFFERAAEAGLIDPYEGGELTLQNYFDAGKLACRTMNADLPLQCLDMTYMGAMLHNGYGLAKHTPLLALKRVHGYEISWALGLAYSVLQNED